MLHKSTFKKYLSESKSTSYFTFARMNPPTIGHEKLLNTMSEQAKGSSYFTFLSHTNDNSKNPLKFDEKVKFSRKMFPKHARSIIAEGGVNSPLSACKYLYDIGIRNAFMVVGSDRLDEFKGLLEKYNNVREKHGFYSFDNIEVISAGTRDPDSQLDEGASATKLRNYAIEENFSAFSQGVPKSFSDADAKKLFNAVRKGMNLEETFHFRAGVKFDPISDTRENYISGGLYQLGEEVILKITNEIVEVANLGTNYVIVKKSDGSKVRKWLDDVEKLHESVGINYKEIWTRIKKSR